MSEADDLQARAEAFADRSIRFVDGLPKGLVAQRLAGQFLDSSTSVASNYRAARRGRSHDEFTAKLGVISEEADECVYWLTRLRNARIASSVPLEPLLAEAIELSKIFAASAKTARSRRRQQTPPPRRSTAKITKYLNPQSSILKSPNNPITKSILKLHIEDCRCMVSP